MLCKCKDVCKEHCMDNSTWPSAKLLNNNFHLPQWESIPGSTLPASYQGVIVTIILVLLNFIENSYDYNI